MSSWREREAHNEARFRGWNEWIEATNHGYGATTAALLVFVCECGDATCAQAIELTSGEYESVRGAADRFAIAPSHEDPETEVVVSEGALRGRRQGGGPRARDRARRRAAIRPSDASDAMSTAGTAPLPTLTETAPG